MADYCTVAEAKALATVESGLSTNTDYDPVFQVLVTTASRLIDREVGRWDNYFYPSSDAGTYYFDGTGEKQIWIDEFVSITSVSVSEQGALASSDYTTWSSSDYITWPYNVTPIKRLDVDIWNGSKIHFDRYPKSVRVVGVRGYSATPPSDVNMACRIQASRWFLRGKQMWQPQGANEEFGSVNINIGGRQNLSRLDPDVVQLLQPYKVFNL